MNLSNPTTIKHLLARHGFHLSKGLGQNFLINPEICPKMAALCGADSQTAVLEIGPGLGVLTRELAAVAGKVVAVELDRRLLPVLKETLADCGNVTVIEGDVLKLDLAALMAEHFSGMNIVVCANLPYYITTPIITTLLERRLPIASITVMVQQEVARRLCAPLPNREAGAVTACVQFFSRPELLFLVDKDSFLPAPKVDSAVIKLTVRESPAVNVPDEALFFRVIKAAFNQRRKTVQNALCAGLALPKEACAAALERAGIPPMARAEQLTLQQFAQLVQNL